SKSGYQGAWQLSVRDIDPSSIVRQGNDRDSSAGSCWWMRIKYDAWATKRSDVQWIQTKDDIPHIPHLIEVHDRQGTEHLLLDGFVRWEQPTRPGQERYAQERRDVWLMLKSYLVRKPEADRFYDWAK